jgi:hypothetical protein
VKKFATALMILVVAAIGGGTAAHATYPPSASIVQVVTGSPGPVDTPFVVRVRGCIPGEQVRFTLPANNQPPVVVTCTSDPTSPEGVATATLMHPGTPGTYTGTVELLTSGRTLQFTIITEADSGTVTIPRTGNSGTGKITTTATVLIGLGIGLFAVAGFRRRRPTSNPAT